MKSSKASSCKLTKAISNSFIWSIANFQSVPVHLLSVYIQPGHAESARENIRLLRWVVSQRILRKDPNSKIVVMGDVNEHMKDLGFLSDAGLVPVVKYGIATHRDGNRLDQVWTNLSVTHSELIKVDDVTSDHMAIQVDLQIKSDGNVKRFNESKTFYTQNDIK